MIDCMRWGCVAIAAVMAMTASPDLAANGARQQAQAAPPLQAADGVRKDLPPGDTHTYAIDLSRGELLHVDVLQHSADIAIAFASPSGQRIEVNSFRDSFPIEELLVEAGEAGAHTLSVTSRAGSVRGGYTVRIRARRRATPADRDRLGAERRFEAALRDAGSDDAAPLAVTFSNIASFHAGSGNVRGEMKALWALGGAEHAFGLPSARATIERALSKARALGDPGTVAGVLTRAGYVLEGQDASREASEAYREAAALYRALSNHKWEANALNSLGNSLRRLGDAERGIHFQLRALDVARAGGSVSVERDTLNNLGIAYKDLGDFRAALPHYEQSLALSRELDQIGNVAGTLNNLGNLRRLMGEHDAALALHTEALSIARGLGDRDNVARSLNTIGLTHYARGDYRAALDHHEQALAMRRELRDLSGQAASLDGAGRALARLAQPAQALTALEEALGIRRAIGDQYLEPDTRLALALVRRDLGDLDAALRDVEAAVDLTDMLRGRVMSPELRASFVAAEQDRYELYVDLLMQLHQREPGGRYQGLALEASERGRARVLLESLFEARIDVRRGIDPAILDEERRAGRAVKAASARLSGLLSREAGAGAIDEARRAVEQAAAEQRRIAARIRDASPGYAALAQPPRLTLAEMQQSLVDADTLLLEFALGEARSWLWVVGPARIDTFELAPRADIEAAARAFHDALAARQPVAGEAAAARAARVRRADEQARHQADALGAMLLRAAAERLGPAWHGKRLLIAAGGALDYVPFASIADPARPGHPLIAGHEIVHLPSASVLAAIRARAAGRERATKTIAVLADPVFAIDDPRVNSGAGAPPGASAQPAEGADAAVALRSFVARALEGAAEPGTARPYRLGRLPFSREEARAIAAYAPAGDRLEAIGFDASRALVTGGALRSYRLVHFATHGVLNSEHPDLSGLILSLVDRDGRARDGFLRLSDIYNLRLTADVVVLSACQTALGKEIRGEGLVGLTRGFLFAGAERVVASLWQVDDLATAELMRRFYGGMLGEGLRPAAALRAAQLALARDPRWSSPFFWSGFTLQGEWR